MDEFERPGTALSVKTPDNVERDRLKKQYMRGHSLRGEDPESWNNIP